MENEWEWNDRDGVEWNKRGGGGGDGLGLYVYFGEDDRKKERKDLIHCLNV